MSLISPLTAGTDIARSFATSKSIAIVSPNEEKASADPFASDRLTLSKQANSKLQSDALAQDITNNTEPANQSVSVSSSTGESSVKGNLTKERAIRLYQAVSSLL